jgi:alpha/beta superfamily hydrolase
VPTKFKQQLDVPTKDCRAHGFGADKTMGLAYYAETFAAAGYACIVFDYRRWGASGKY